MAPAITNGLLAHEGIELQRCIAHDNTVYVMDRTIVLRCVKMGPQPAHLFQVPKGIK